MDNMKMSFENVNLQIPMQPEDEMKVKEVLSISAIVPIEVTVNGASFVMMSQESFDELMESEEDLEEILEKQQNQFCEEFQQKQSQEEEETCYGCPYEENCYDYLSDDGDFYEEDHFPSSTFAGEVQGDVIVSVIMDLLDENKLSKEQLVHLGEIVEAQEVLATAREIYGGEDN